MVEDGSDDTEVVHELGCEVFGSLGLACFDGRQSCAAQPSVDALFKEIQHAVDLGSLPKQVGDSLGFRQHGQGLLQKPVAGPKGDNAIAQGGEVVVQTQEGAGRLHKLLLLLRKGGTQEGVQLTECTLARALARLEVSDVRIIKVHGDETECKSSP